MSELAAALVAFQADAPKIERSKSMRVTTKSGGEYSFTYAPLDAILSAVTPKLAENGLAVSQLLSWLYGAAGTPAHPALRTVLLHTSGEKLEAEFPLPVNGHETAQEIGSLISYMRRYALVAVLGLATEEDDDGNAASGNRAVSGGGERRPASDPAASSADGATQPQVKKLHAMHRKLVDSGRINEVEWADHMQATYETTSFAELSKAEASKVIDAFERIEAEDIPF